MKNNKKKQGLNPLDTYKIIFAGTPEFAAEALEALIQSRHDIVAVYTQPDRPSGRGKKLVESPVKQLACKHLIPVEQPPSFKNAPDIDTLATYDADIMVVAAYGIILPLTVLAIPKKGCLNIHASLLPRWRGAAPIQRAIQAGDTQSGISIMLMAEGLDTGDVLLIRKLEIGPNEIGSELHDRLAVLGQSALLQTLDDFNVYYHQRCPQKEGLANYAHKLTKKEASVDWSLPAQTIHNQIRAFNSWPVSFSTLDEYIIRIWKSHFEIQSHPFENGEICSHTNQCIGVACSDGIIYLEKIQLPGKRALSSKEILNAKKDLFSIGCHFEF